MKLAITDACIFIDIYELQLTSQFFGLELEVHTSLDVFNELHQEQKRALGEFMNAGKLITHSMTAEDRLEIKNYNFPKSLSENDKTVIHLAIKIDALILSSDKPVRQQAKKMCIEYHGMLWILDELLKASVIGYSQAIDKLQKLIKSNIVYQGNAELQTEMENRVKQWSRNV